MKRLLKSIIQGATAAIAPLLWKMRPAPRLLILMYHRVLPADHPARATEQPGMYVSPATLAMHIAVLKQHFTLMHLDDWVQRQQRGESLPKNACALTFDDGWLDNYQHAWPVLKAANAPATIFLVSDLVGTAYEFWPNRLLRLLTTPTIDGRGATSPASLQSIIKSVATTSSAIPDVDAIIERCKQQYSDAQMLSMIEEWEQAFGFTPAAMQRDLMSWQEISQMRSNDLVRFGSHSRRHTRLRESLAASDAEDEISGSQMAIESHLSKRPVLFCYPNGDFSRTAVDMVKACYVAAVTTRRGWHTPESDALLMNRVGMHEDVSKTRISFLSRLAGVG